MLYSWHLTLLSQTCQSLHLCNALHRHTVLKYVCNNVCKCEREGQRNRQRGEGESFSTGQDVQGDIFPGICHKKWPKLVITVQTCPLRDISGVCNLCTQKFAKLNDNMLQKLCLKSMIKHNIVFVVWHYIVVRYFTASS